MAAGSAELQHATLGVLFQENIAHAWAAVIAKPAGGCIGCPSSTGLQKRGKRLLPSEYNYKSGAFAYCISGVMRV